MALEEVFEKKMKKMQDSYQMLKQELDAYKKDLDLNRPQPNTLKYNNGNCCYANAETIGHSQVNNQEIQPQHAAAAAAVVSSTLATVVATAVSIAAAQCNSLSQHQQEEKS